MKRVWLYIMNAIINRSLHRENATIFVVRNKHVVLLLLAGAIFIDSIFIKISSDVVIFGLLAAYGIYIKLTQTTSNVTFLFCLTLLTALLISFISSSASISTEKFAVWLFLFMGVGIIQELRK